MFSVVFLVILASAVSGLAVKWWLDSSRADKEITKTEYWVGVVLISLLVAPLATKAGWEIAKKNLIEYENRNFLRIEALDMIKHVQRFYEYAVDILS